jgi:predicted nucleic acid-binding protein
VTSFVLDCSIAVTWCFDDEATPETDALMDRVKEYGAFVPSLWPLEVANVLLLAERRGRSSPAHITSFVQRLDTLPIHVDGETASRALGGILPLARSEGLTTYDASYLDLAMRLGLPLATKDEALKKAGGRAGVALLP